MRDTNLVNALREHAEWAWANEWETPITLGDDLTEAADRIEAQAKEIEKLRGQVPHWIPVEERLPENFRKVLCWGEYFRYGDFMQIEVAVEIQKAYSKLTSGQVPFTKKNMCAILAPLRDKYGLTDRQVLAVARNELSLEEIMLLNQTQEETKQHG